MKLENLTIFPTEIKVFRFNIPQIQPIIDEVLSKKDQIKQRSDIYSNHGGVGESEYITDYKNPVKLHEFEKLMMIVGSYFAPQNNFFHVNYYWTAFYGKNVLHDTHMHGNFNDKKRLTHNFSSVLYLTENGGTTFYSPNLTSNVDDYLIKSEVGKFIMFPHNLFHNGNNRAEMHGGENQNRFIISANIELFENENGA